MKIGSMYDRGEGCIVDKRKAFELYAKSAVQGHASALFNLGLFFILVISCHFLIFNIIGIMLNKGEGVIMDTKRAFEMFQRSGELGYASSFFNLGININYFFFFFFNI